jgi:hypothetical protein
MNKLLFQHFINHLLSVLPVCLEADVDPIGTSRIVLEYNLVELAMGLYPLEPFAPLLQVTVNAQVSRLAFRVL